MRRTARTAAVFTLTILGGLTLASPAAAWAVRPASSLVRPGPYRPNHMPGWDWWRTYPWSPYNYGRNPYNPILVPYPYSLDTPAAYGIGPAFLPPATPTATDPTLALPSVSGPMTSPPPGTALLEVHVPATWARVSFNGHDSFTSGTRRWFVTPTLGPSGATYTIAASWTQFGRPVTHSQKVHLQPGQTRVIDLDR